MKTKCFMFKVNYIKIHDKEALNAQINKIMLRLIKNNNIDANNVNIYFGTINDDFVKNIFRTRICFTLN